MLAHKWVFLPVPIRLAGVWRNANPIAHVATRSRYKECIRSGLTSGRPPGSWTGGRPDRLDRGAIEVNRFARLCSAAPQAGVCWWYATYKHLSANKGYVVSFVAGDPWDSWTSAFAFDSRGQGEMADSRRAPRAPLRNESGPVYPCPAARPFLSEIWLGQSRSSSHNTVHLGSSSFEPRAVEPRSGAGL